MFFSNVIKKDIFFLKRNYLIEANYIRYRDRVEEARNFVANYLNFQRSDLRATDILCDVTRE